MVFWLVCNVKEFFMLEMFFGNRHKSILKKYSATL